MVQLTIPGILGKRKFLATSDSLFVLLLGPILESKSIHAIFQKKGKKMLKR